ncbi:MAG: hypothetical protein R8G34_13970 [Paracoccaceae bacterium]|nr:hypothetical protein [Paracoccaceae bacterium]
MIALREPALMFSVQTPVVSSILTQTCGFFVKGEMEIKAKYAQL